MDKQNYIIKNINKQEVKRNFSKIIKYIENKLEKLDLIKRRRKVKSYKILIIAAFKHIVENLSYQRLSDYMSLNYDVSMSDTAWKKRLALIAPHFHKYAMEYLNEHCLPPSDKIFGKTNVYAIETTEIAVEGGKGKTMRAHTCLSISSVGNIDVRITDQHTAEAATNFKLMPNALYIADRAYGKAKNIAYAYQRPSDFMFRISPSHIALYLDTKCKHKLDFEKFLSGKKSFSRKFYFNYNKKIYSVRIVGAMIPAEKQESAMKKVKRKSIKKQHKIKPETLIFSQWLIIATSLTKPTRNQIIQCYRKRWTIELHFKKIKSLLRFRKIRHSLSEYMETSVYLWLAVAFLILSVRVSVSHFLNFDFSEFNVFSLIVHSFS